MPKYRQSEKPVMPEVITLLEEIQAQQRDERRPDSQAHWVAVPGPAHSPPGKGSQELHQSRCSHTPQPVRDVRGEDSGLAPGRWAS